MKIKAMLKVCCSVVAFAWCPASSAATVVEFYHTTLDHYFITADANEAAAIDKGSAGAGWVRTGYNFETGSGTAPVCRFYGVFKNGTVGSHFYTADAGECAFVKGKLDWGWGYEGDAFNIAVPVNGVCLNNGTPVYRAYNDAKGGAVNHRITTNVTAIQEVVARGWINEGVVMCAPQITAATCNTIAHASPYFPVGDYSISNNTWGKGDIPDTAFHQCISGGAIMTDGVQTGISAEWDWVWPNYTYGQYWGTIKSAPNIMYAPGGENLVPIPVASLDTLTLSHDITISDTNSDSNFNFIYAMFFDSTPTGLHRWAPDVDVNIFLQSSWIEGPVVDTQYFDGNLYDVVVRPIECIWSCQSGATTRPFIVFQSKVPLLKATIHVKPFIDYLVAKGHLPSNYYLASVVLENEVVAGTGTVVVNKFSVTR